MTQRSRLDKMAEAGIGKVTEASLNKYLTDFDYIYFSIPSKSRPEPETLGLDNKS